MFVCQLRWHYTRSTRDHIIVHSHLAKMSFDEILDIARGARQREKMESYTPMKAKTENKYE